MIKDMLRVCMCVRMCVRVCTQALYVSLRARITVGKFHFISQHYQEGCIFILYIHI